MANHVLPSIYLGASTEAETLHKKVKDTHQASKASHPSMNQFLKHLILLGLEAHAANKTA